MEKVKKVLMSDWWLLPLSVIVVLCWALDVALISISILAVYYIVSMLFLNDYKSAVFPVFVLPYVFSTQDLNYYFENMVYLIVLLVLIILSTIYFIYRQIVINKVRFEKGYLFWGIIATAIASVLAGAFSNQFKIMISLITLIVCGVLFAIYFLCRNFLKGDCKKYLCYCLLVTSGVVMAEMLISGFMTGNFIDAVSNKKIRVGIDEINAAATLLGATVPICFYLALEGNKSKYLWFLLATILLVFVAISCSRGALLFSLVVAIATLVYYLVKCKQKKQLICYLAGLAAVCLVLIAIFHSTIFELFSWYAERGFDDTGRFEIYAKCFDIFKNNPIFGVGYVTEYVVVPGTELLITHSTIIQILASLGCVGLVAYGLYYYQRYSLLFKSKDIFSIFVLFSLLVAEFYGFIDTFHMNVFLIMTFYIFSAECEKAIGCKNDNLSSTQLNEKS